MSAGRLIAVVGPSGAGKDTLLAAALAARPDLVRARRVITRPQEAGGEAFEGVSAAEFEARLRRGAFALHWRAHGLRYGVPARIDTDLAAGHTVLFNGSRAALPAARARYPALEVVMITAPARLLAERLAARGREDAGTIAARLARGTLAVPSGARIVVNDASAETGAARLLCAINPEAEGA